MSRNFTVLLAGLLSFAVHARAAQVDESLSRAIELQRRGSLEPARAEYERVRAAARDGHNDSKYAAALAGMAQIDLALGRYPQCAAEATEALARFRVLSNKTEEARILTTRGQASFYTGDSEAALRDFAQGLQIVRDLGDREQEITTLNNIGNVYYGEGRYGDAFQHYQTAEKRLEAAGHEPWYGSRQQLTQANLAVLYQRLGQYNRALQIYQRVNPERGQLPVRERAQMLGNMGTLYRRLGDPVAALERYRAAQLLFHKSALLAGEVGVLNNIGIAQTLDMSIPDAAAQTFTEALLLARKSGGKRLIMTSLLYRGEAFLRGGKLAEARADFEASSGVATELKAGEEKWKSDYGLARVADREGDRRRSDDLLRGCIATIERLRKGSSIASGRTGFLIERREVYDLLIEHEAVRADASAAAVFELMEQSRARDMQDRTQAQASGIDELRRRLPADTLLLEYWVSAGSMAVISISGSQTSLMYRALAESDVRVLTELAAALTDPKSDSASISQAAGRILLNGINAIGEPGLRRLVVIPDGGLARIPFEALPVGKGLLIDRVSVSYLPFGGAFRSGKKARGFWPPWKKTMMAFADPAAGSRGKDLGMIAEENVRLPEAASEVRHAGDAVGGRVQLHLGGDARKQYLLAAKKATAPLLHLATHAFADLDDPERSYILFAPANDDQSFDYLFLKEAAGLSLNNVKLVTVSACDSGAGQFTSGEGVQNFGLAFLSAGAQAVLTSLWRTGDRSSAALITRFYDSMAAGNTAADALREAKLAFRRSNSSASRPAYWAGFVLTGEGDVTIPQLISWKLLLAGLAGLMAVGCGILLTVRKQAGTARRSPRSHPR